MPPALYTKRAKKRAKEQLAGPGICEVKASLRSWLAWWLDKDSMVCVGVLILQARFKAAPLGKRNEWRSQLLLSAPLLHGTQIKRDAVVP